MKEYSLIALIVKESFLIYTSNLGEKADIGYSLEAVIITKPGPNLIRIMRFTEDLDKGFVEVCKRDYIIGLGYIISDTTNIAVYSNKISFKLYKL